MDHGRTTIVNKTFKATQKPTVIRRGLYVSIETTGTAEDREGREVAALRIEEYSGTTTEHARSLKDEIEKKLRALCLFTLDPGIIGRDKHPGLSGVGYSIGYIKR